MRQTVKIESLDHFGRGIAFIDGKITFVDNALDKETVQVEITSSKKKYNLAKPIKFIEKSKERVEYSCPYYKVCGGCSIAYFSDKKQEEFKKNKVKNILQRYTKYEEIKIKKYYKAEDLFYRNKVTLHIKNNKLGFYKEKSQDLVEIKECLLVDKKINKVIQELNTYLKNTKTKIKEITIRSSLLEIMLLINGETDPSFIEMFSKYNLVINEKEIVNHDYILDELLGKKFVIRKDSFYQVNKKQVENLYQIAIDYVKSKKYNTILDLYCGTGTIGILLSDYVKKVIGIEINPRSIESANENKEKNQVKNISFLQGKAEQQIDKIKEKIDLIVVDPPRSGLEDHVITMIKESLSKAIIYISCDPMTLARDIEKLRENYNLKEVSVVDMFKNTYHVETVCVLERK